MAGLIMGSPRTPGKFIRRACDKDQSANKESNALSKGARHGPATGQASPEHIIRLLRVRVGQKEKGIAIRPTCVKRDIQNLSGRWVGGT